MPNPDEIYNNSFIGEALNDEAKKKRKETDEARDAFLNKLAGMVPTTDGDEFVGRPIQGTWPQLPR